MKKHRRAIETVLATLLLDLACGWAYAVAQDIPVWHGMYCALANAVTFGGDVAPSTPAGYVINTIECLLVIPLFGASFSFFTTSLTTVQVHDRTASLERRLLGQLEGRIAAHHKALASSMGVEWQPPPVPPGAESWQPQPTDQV